MFLRSIKLKSFRNLADVGIKFTKNITVLIGDNAQGKTNFLESIYFLGSGRPIKTETDEEIINFGEKFVNIEGIVETRENSSIKISNIIQKTNEGIKKRFLVNDIPRRMLDYAGQLVTVYFRPEDIDLVTGSPSARRQYIDSTLSQVDKEYRKILNSYQKIIIQKNKLLKLIREALAKLDELDFWNGEQLRLATLIHNKRQNFFDTINSFERKFGDFDYKYLPNRISQERLSELQDKEIQAAMSLCGPHRDDFVFILNEKDLAKYGSRGEQRTAVLDLKITELSFFEKILTERPVLLLDDIFSELDELHRQHVLDLSKLQQTIIATVEYDDYLKKSLESEQVLNVNKGLISF